MFIDLDRGIGREPILLGGEHEARLFGAHRRDRNGLALGPIDSRNGGRCIEYFKKFQARFGIARDGAIELFFPCDAGRIEIGDHGFAQRTFVFEIALHADGLVADFHHHARAPDARSKACRCGSFRR